MIYNVMSNGYAPAGLSVGDYVNTGGGMYMIAAPGADGAIYNPKSGYWSVRSDASNYTGAANNSTSPNAIQSVLNSARTQADLNTDRSQALAREQMSYQTAANAKAMAYNSAEADRNRRWQQEMSNTAHQREVRDLMSAGLNPVLSVNRGAAVGSGATASGVTSSGASGQVDQSYNNMLGSIINSLISRQTSVDIANIQSDTSRQIAQIQAAVNRYMSDNSLSGVLGGATISAQSALALADKNNAFRDYLERNYPSSIVSGISNIMHGINDVYNGNTGRNASVVKQTMDSLGGVIGHLYRYLQESRRYDSSRRGN